MKRAVLFLLPVLIAFSAFAGGMRGRPKIIDGQVRADNGYPLRGDMIYTADPVANPTHWWINAYFKNNNLWQWYVDSLRLNAVRVCLYRYPLNYGANAPTPGYVPNIPRTGQVRNDRDIDRHYSNQVVYDSSHVFVLLDTMVNRCERYGMYLMIDYHCIYNIDTVDWYKFWRRVAPRYRNKFHVFYELANEPMPHPRPANFRLGYMGHRDVTDTISPYHKPHQKGWMTGFQKRAHNFVRALAPQTLLILCSFSGSCWGQAYQPNMTAYIQQDLMTPGVFGTGNFNWDCYTAVGWHGYYSTSGTTAAWPKFRDSVRYNCNPKFPTLMTEHTMGLQGGISTWAQVKAAIQRDIFGAATEYAGRGYVPGGHSFFIQTFTGAYGTNVYNGTATAPSNGRVLISEAKKGTWTLWAKDPKTGLTTSPPMLDEEMDMGLNPEDAGGE